MHNITTIDLNTTLPITPDQTLITTGTIARNTANTWQPQRSQREKFNDTQVGKLAEDALACYLAKSNIAYRSWDDVRTDNFQQHAPLDGFIARANATHILHHPRFTAAANDAQQQTHFDLSFVEKCEQHGLYGVEVKSTRISPRHRNSEGKVDVERILNDDFLLYPKIRYGQLTTTLRQTLLMPENLTMTAQRTPFFLIRIYLEQLSETTYRAYLMGYLTRKQFFISPRLTVKSMPRRGKSERAIYYAVPLRAGRPVKDLQEFVQ